MEVRFGALFERNMAVEKEFKSGRADIMKQVNAVEEKGYTIFADHVLQSYDRERRFGYYTSWMDFAQVNMIHKGQ